MATLLTNTNELTSVADAIRAKGGTSNQLIYPNGFISAINNISPSLQTKSVTYTPTTSQQTDTITADSGYDGLSELDVTIEAVTTTNLTASNIVSGVTVKVGTATDDDSVISVTGTASGGGNTCMLTNSGSVNSARVTYNGISYYTANDSFTFSSGDTLTIYCNYGDTNHIIINGVIVASGSSGSATRYNFTLPSCDIEITFSLSMGLSKILISVPSLSITTNGTYDVGDYGYADVNVSPTLQSKTVTPTTAQQTITADSGYDGLSSVVVSGDTNLQASKIANGESIFGVTGTYGQYYNIYKSLATNSNYSCLTSTVEDVQDWCDSLSTITDRMFEGRNFGGTFTFTNATYIGGGAFARARAWNIGTQHYFSVCFPNASYIGSYAFYNNFGLKSIDCPRVTAISGSAFYECRELTTVSFPLCSSMQSYAFYECYSLASANFPVLSIVPSLGFKQCSSLTTAIFPQVTILNNQAFESCNKLVTISFPNATFISTLAFASCSALSSAYFPNVSVIGISAFINCMSLTEVNFPKAQTISSYAFSGCKSLTTASFPICTYIGDRAFHFNDHLLSIDCPECTYIGSSAFADCRALSIAYFSSCTSIGQYAFATGYELTTISLPLCTNIGSFAFNNCPKLTTVNIPAVTTIGYMAFADCTSLTTISLSTVISIHSYAFQNCYNLISLNLTGISSVPELSGGSWTFRSTPIGGYSTSAGQYGSVYVPASLYSSFLTTSGWSTISSRIVSV